MRRRPHLAAPTIGVEGSAREEPMSEAAIAAPSLGWAALIALPGATGARLRALADPPADPHALAGRRVALLATHGVEEVELLPVRAWLAVRGAAVELVAPDPPAPGVIAWPPQAANRILAVRFMENAAWVPLDRRLREAVAGDYDAVVVPGGAWNPDLLRADPAVLAFLRAAWAAGRVVAAICHGPLVLAEAGLLRGRRATCFGAVRSDIRNAGAVVEDAAAVADGRLVTGRGPRDLPDFLDALAAALTPEDRPAMTTPVPLSPVPPEERRAAGLAILAQAFGAEYAAQRPAGINSFNAPLRAIVEEFAFGTIWTRPGLPMVMRSMLCLVILATLGRAKEMRLHVVSALNNGASVEEIREVLLHLVPYAGIPAAVEAFRVAEEVLREQGRL
jgi:protease I